MKTILFIILFIFCTVQVTYSQVEDGVIALDIPVRNSLMFNRFEVNPTFSFVREQNKYISVTNKRELIKVEDAPQTYLVNYAGRFRENIGAGIGVFQQNYGVFTNFGGLVNFAYNVRLEEESNLTFGMNVGVYKSGLNNGSIITNFQDPALNNIPSNFLATINPGINYGAGFMDFGVSLNNALTYNFESTGLLEDNPRQGIQGHIMYTGYFGGYGFLGESRFSALARSEFQKNATIHSGVLMLTVPKGIWAQVGYNNLYGASGGLGVNITQQIAVEYNYERPLTGFSNLGAAHEITLAYRFKNDNYYDYSRDDEIAGIFSLEKKSKKSTFKKAQISEAPQGLEETITTPVETIKEETEIATELKRDTNEEATRVKKEDQAAQRIAQERLAAEELERQEAEMEARNLAAKQKIAAEKQRIARENRERQMVEQQQIIAAERARIEAEQQQIIAAEKGRQEAEQKRIITENESKLIKEEVVTPTPIVNPTDKIGKSIGKLSQQTEASRTEQATLLNALEKAVTSKANDLKDLKEENDLSEQNIYVAPKPFKSISEENKAIETLIIQLDTTIIRFNKKVIELETLMQERLTVTSDPLDETNLYYTNRLKELKKDQETARRARETLVSSLEKIAIATDFERKRRIKRAAFDNDQDRYTQDRAALQKLKETVSYSETIVPLEAFDFGEERTNNIEILKNVAHADNGFYLVIAVHNTSQKRDEFLTQVIASGNRKVDFFYDVNTSKYYIYIEKHNGIREANDAVKSMNNQIYNQKISIIKIEN